MAFDVVILKWYSVDDPLMSYEKMLPMCLEAIFLKTESYFVDIYSNTSNFFYQSLSIICRLKSSSLG
jgi:hypothetical protein